MMKLKFQIFTLLIFGVGALKAQPHFSVSLDSSNLLIGQTAQLKIIAQVNKEDSYLWPTFADTLGGLEILEVSDLKEQKEKGQLILSQFLAVTSFDSGYYVVPPQLFIVNQDSLLSDPVIVQFNNVPLGDAQQFYEIKNPVKAPFSWPRWATWALVAIHILLLIWAFLMLKRKTKTQAVAEIKDLRTPLQKFNDALQNIVSQNTLETESDKVFYSDLTLAIRSYLQEEFNIQALENTTYTIQPEIEALYIDVDFKKQILALLQEADMVKFAKLTSSLNAKQNHLNNMRLFLNQQEKEAQNHVESNNTGHE